MLNKLNNLNKGAQCLLVIIISGIILLFVSFIEIGFAKRVSYGQLVDYINSGEVDVVNFNRANGSARITINGKSMFSYVPNDEIFTKNIEERLEKGDNLVFSVKYENDMVQIALSILPPLILVLGTLVVMKGVFKKNGGIMGNTDLILIPTKTKTCFEDVAGIEEERSQVMDVVNYLRNPEKFNEMGARIPKGILLVGPPGNGKTLLARALAGEANVDFYSFSGSSFEEKLVGVGASRIRSIFEELKMKDSPSIVFIDEIDAMGRDRVHDENGAQTLNQLLTEMDGFEKNSNIVVLAATNNYSLLDPALVRPGRFDRIVRVSSPDKNARIEILKLHAEGKKFEDDVQFEKLAKLTAGFSGADLENLLNEAAIIAVTRDAKAIASADLDEAFYRVAVGLKKKRCVSENELKTTAYHEAGHAVAANYLQSNSFNFGISIIPRGDAAGFNCISSGELGNRSKEAIEQEIAVLYAGREAERFFFDQVSIGASNDYQKASNLVYKMVTEWNLVEKDVFMVKIPGEKTYNETLEKNRYDETEIVAKRCNELARKTIEEHKDEVEALALLLLEKEVLSADEITAFFSNHK